MKKIDTDFSNTYYNNPQKDSKGDSKDKQKPKDDFLEVLLEVKKEKENNDTNTNTPNRIERRGDNGAITEVNRYDTYSDIRHFGTSSTMASLGFGDNSQTTKQYGSIENSAGGDTEKSRSLGESRESRAVSRRSGATSETSENIHEIYDRKIRRQFNTTEQRELAEIEKELNRQKSIQTYKSADSNNRLESIDLPIQNEEDMQKIHKQTQQKGSDLKNNKSNAISLKATPNLKKLSLSKKPNKDNVNKNNISMDSNDMLNVKSMFAILADMFRDITNAIKEQKEQNKQKLISNITKEQEKNLHLGEELDSINSKLENKQDSNKIKQNKHKQTNTRKTR